MSPFGILRGTAAALFEENIDTDQICPKQHLKALKRTGFDAALFSDYRFAPDGAIRPEFVLNRSYPRKTTIMIGGPNFACGSSREHAVWALVDYGIRCVIAPSFGDIFLQNSVNSGLLAIIVPHEIVAALALVAENHAGAEWTIDLPQQLITPPESEVVPFDIDAARKKRLLEGLDEIALTLQYRGALENFEARQRNEEPWLWS